jgi:hypothetical protein
MSGAKPPVACEACAGYPYGTGRVHCNGCAESASLRQRLATAEAATRQSDAWYRTALKQAERYDQESRTALADAAALRERVTRAEALLAEAVELLTGARCPAVLANEAPTADFERWYTRRAALSAGFFTRPTPIPTEPDGASGNRQGDDK